MFTINLNTESAAVLLRCLQYGQNAVSAAELKNGVGTVIVDNIELIRKQICTELVGEVISAAANKNK